MTVPFKPLFAGQTEQDIRDFIADRKLPAFRARQITEWYWNKKITDFDQMANLPKDIRQLLSEHFSLEPLTILDITGEPGRTQKFLSRLRDGNCIESVIIPAAQARDGKQSNRLTLCVSSQVGCAFGCKFCASGLFGLTRNLEAGEIISQILAAEAITGQTVNNLVFMGMGEPLANYDNLLRALDIITSPAQLNIGARHITISTSGHAPHIRKLASYPKQIRLALSLHGATDETRSKIMPVNKKWPLKELKTGLAEWTEKKKQKMTFEYILIHHVNDSDDDAKHLVQFCKGLPAKINLIPYNQVEGLSWERPPISRCQQFKNLIEQHGITVTMRYEKGHDINAACGQLRLRKMNESQHEHPGS